MSLSTEKPKKQAFFQRTYLQFGHTCVNSMHASSKRDFNFLRETKFAQLCPAASYLVQETRNNTSRKKKWKQLRSFIVIV